MLTATDSPNLNKSGIRKSVAVPSPNVLIQYLIIEFLYTEVV